MYIVHKGKPSPPTSGNPHIPPPQVHSPIPTTVISKTASGFPPLNSTAAFISAFGTAPLTTAELSKSTTNFFSNAVHNATGNENAQKLNMSSVTEKDSTNTINTTNTTNTNNTTISTDAEVDTSSTNYTPFIIGGAIILFFFLKKR